MDIDKQFTSLKKPTTDRFFLPPGALILVIIVNLLFTTHVFAQNSATTKTLVLREAIALTIENSPELKPFYFQLIAQQAKLSQADTSPKPELALTVEDALGTGDFSGIDSAEATLGISWILEGQVRNKRVDLARSSQSVIETEREIKLVDVAAQTTRYFLQALALQQQVEIANQSIAVMTNNLNDIKKRSGVGRASAAELLSTEADIAQRELVLLDINYQLEIAYRQLAAQWGETQATFDRVDGSLTALPNLISFDSLKQQLANSPYLEKYLSLERFGEAELRLAEQQSKRQPWKLSTGLRRYEASDDFGVVAGISVPIGGRQYNRGRIAEAQANADIYRAEGAAARIRIETDLYRLYRQLQYNSEQSNVLANTVVPKLEQAQNEIRQGYERGRHSYLELLTVQNKLVDAQFELLTSRLNAHRSLVEIERLTGSQLTSQN